MQRKEEQNKTKVSGMVHIPHQSHNNKFRALNTDARVVPCGS